MPSTTYSQRRAAKLLEHIATERAKVAEMHVTDERKLWEAQDAIIWNRRARAPWPFG